MANTQTRFVVIEMQNGSIGDNWWSYDNRADAETKMFQVLAEVVKSPIEVHTVMLMTDEGDVLETRCYRHDAAPAEGE